MLPRLQGLFGAELEVRMEAADLPLLVGREGLERMLTQLVLHARAGVKAGLVRVVLEGTRLGGRLWAVLRVQAEGPRAASVPVGFLGLSWLQEQVAECRGMLELLEARGNGVQPRIYLPVEGAGEPAELQPLAGRTVWIVEGDALVRDALAGLVQRAGGGCRCFADLKGFLRASRGSAPPTWR